MSKLVLVQERTAGDVTILDFKGKIQHGDGVLDLRRAIHRLLEEGKLKILLNLEEVTRVDDSALMDIKATLLRSVESCGGELKVMHANNIKGVNEVYRLGMLVDCFDSEIEALMAFR